MEPEYLRVAIAKARSGELQLLPRIQRGLEEFDITPELVEGQLRGVVDTALRDGRAEDPGYASLRYQHCFWQAPRDQREEMLGLIRFLRSRGSDPVEEPEEGFHRLIPYNPDLDYLMALLEKHGIPHQPVFDEFLPGWEKAHSTEAFFNLDQTRGSGDMDFSVNGDQLRMVHYEGMGAAGLPAHDGRGSVKRPGYEGIKEEWGLHIWAEVYYNAIAIDLARRTASRRHISYDDLLEAARQACGYRSVDDIPRELREDRSSAWLTITDPELRAEALARLLADPSVGVEVGNGFQDFGPVWYQGKSDPESRFLPACTRFYIELREYAASLGKERTPYDGLLTRLRVSARENERLARESEIDEILATVVPSYRTDPFSGYH